MVYSFDTTPEQEDAISFKRLQLNAERDAKGLPVFKGNQEYVEYFTAVQIIGPLIAEFVEAKLQKVADAYRSGADTDRRAVEATLNVTAIDVGAIGVELPE